MPVQLDIQAGRFHPIREKAGAFVADGTPNAAAPANPAVDITQVHGSSYLTMYWGGTTPGGTVNVVLWHWDGIANTWVEGATVTGLAPLKLATAKCYGGDQIYAQITGSPTGTNVTLRAISSNVA